MYTTFYVNKKVYYVCMYVCVIYSMYITFYI